jgi:hypothetical protein
MELYDDRIKQSEKLFEVGNILGGSVSVDDTLRQQHKITFPDGKVILITTIHGSFFIRGTYPKYKTKNFLPQRSPEINIHASKAANVIAREITRRFLPKYTEEYAEAVEAYNEHVEYLNLIKQRKDALCSAGWQDTYENKARLQKPGIFGEVEIFSQSYRFNIDIQDAVANQILKVLAEYKEES